MRIRNKIPEHFKKVIKML